MSSKKPSGPPTLADRLVAFLIGDHLQEEFRGDLIEIYEDRHRSRGKRYASIMYWVDALHLTIAFYRNKPSNRPMRNSTMYKHYFLISLRNLSRNKVYASINIVSLAVGLGVSLAIAQYVFMELNPDQSLTKNPDIYRLTLERNQSGSLVDKDLYTAHSLGTIAKDEIPEVTAFTRLYVPDEGAYIANSGQTPFSLQGNEMYYVDTNFIEFFELELLAGDPHYALDDLYNVVISEKVAQRLFGEANPIGKMISIGGGASHGDYQVTGVFHDRPDNSHLRFDFLFPLKNFMEYGWLGAIKRNPHLPWFATYFQLNPESNTGIVQDRLDKILASHKTEWNPELMLTENTILQPLDAIHLDANNYINGDYVINKGSQSDINSLVLVAVFILVIAWFNYINLSTARSITRAKEVGIRKSLGAKKTQLIFQFLSEAITINIFAAILALAIGYLSIDLLAVVMGQKLSFSLLTAGNFWLWYVAVIFLGSFLSGYYPAFLLSKHRPINILSVRVAPKASNFNLRRVLVTFQFIVSLLLISGTYLVYKQINYMKSEDLGMDMSQVLVVKGPKHIEVLDGGPQLTSYEGLQAFQKYSSKMFVTFRSEMQKIPAIQSVAGSWLIPGDVYHTLEDDIRRWGTPESENQSVRIVGAGLDFVRTYDLQLLAGETFNTDLVGSRSVIINERALKAFGFTSPEEAVGDRLEFGRPLEIVGVVKDFHWQSLKEDHSPWIIKFTSSTPEFFSMKLKSTNLQETMPKIQAVYDKLYPGNPFEYFFIDDQFNHQYQSDLQFGNLFLILTLLAIIIACVGLFALISYSTTMRVKEIGVRKVLGASVSQLMFLLSREYFRLLVLATLLAVPLIIYLGNSWLNNYAFRIDLGVDIFILPGVALAAIAVITVSHRTFSAARTNPVESLRSE